MKTLKSVMYKQKNIFIVDIRNTQPETAIDIFREVQPQIATLPRNSVLILTDATNARYNRQSAAAMKEFAAQNSPFVKASAVVGADGLREVLLDAVRFFTRRPIKACATREEALEWLVAHG